MKLKMETSNGKTLLESTNTPEGVILEPQYLAYIRSQGYVIDNINEYHTVESSDSEHAYLVYEIDTYKYPHDSPRLDIANPAHQVSTYVCSCPDFRFNQSADVRDANTSPDDSGTCRHIREVSKVEKAKQDDSQATIGDLDA